MISISTGLVFVELFIGLSAAIVASIAWTHRDRAAGVPVCILLIAASGYAFMSGLNVLVSEPLLKHLIHNLTYPFVTAAVASVIYILIEFTYGEKYRQPRIIGILVGYVSLSFVISITDPIHHLLITEPVITANGGFSRTAENAGPLFWIQAITNFTVAFVSLGWMVAKFPDTRGIHRQQMMTLILAYLIALAFFLWQTLSPPHPAFDVATIGLLGASLLILWTLFYSDFLKTTPIEQRTLLDNVPSAVIAVDASDRVLNFNQKAGNLYDLDTSAIGVHAEQVFQTNPELLERLGTADRSETQITLERDGVKRHYDLTISPIVDSDMLKNRSRGSLIVLQDITRLVQQRDELKQKNKRLDQFAGIVSHDLRNPLNVAVGWLEVARETGNTDHLERVERGHTRMQALIDDLLMLARESDLEGDRELITLSDEIGTCWQNVDTEDATLVNEANGMVFANLGRFRQLIENLIRNSIEHGGKTVTITVGDLGQGFYVEDNGSGIPQGNYDRLFDAGHTTSQDGTGLGLAIVKQITDDHGWEITGAEGADGGVRFEITGVASTAA
ncbi:histidine kinase N-terminal 7TM domain-containing protein [Halohasta litorea]|uniref:histidine kinase n=1 Tax=Halohasta litorea TaxID=869891 RepID=A0ABD6D9H4_9EURY|nr:histidine kinase N-terminal 7TM domain-containing protein [Halohasta litorea]